MTMRWWRRRMRSWSWPGLHSPFLARQCWIFQISCLVTEPAITHSAVHANIHAHHQSQWQKNVDNEVQVVAVDLQSKSGFDTFETKVDDNGTTHRNVIRVHSQFSYFDYCSAVVIVFIFSIVKGDQALIRGCAWTVQVEVKVRTLDCSGAFEKARNALKEKKKEKPCLHF